jgi:hypothetical protein
MNRYSFRLTLALAAVGGVSWLGTACTARSVIVGDEAGSTGSAPSSGGGADPGVVAGCLSTGVACEDDAGCCGGYCAPETKLCSPPLMACLPEGGPCTEAFSCCGLSCLAGRCAAACVSDGGSCAAGDECCGGVCVSGLCVALNAGCLTSGNECAVNSDCCSGYCDSGRCSIFSSFCIQQGDACRTASECCTGSCERAAGAELGVCGAAPSGPSNCTGVAGSLCGDCNECCSRVCGPYGPSGLTICQPASGCRVTGELCRRDLDCCGGDPESGLPGAGNVTCVKDPGKAIGLCRNALACSPQGNVCHFKEYACSVSSASNRCCDGTAAGACELDALGIPRCNGLADACRGFREFCASPEDCCDGLSCLPRSDGRWICSNTGEQCVAQGGTCSTSADCCSALLCEIAAGNPAGTCVEKASGSCSELGQLCDEAAPCCPGLACTAGRCGQPAP